MKRVLLTGATGFIGRHCLDALRKRDFEVHAITREIEKRDSPGEVYWHQADLLKREGIRELVSRVEAEYLLHLAWYAAPGKYWSSLENLRWLQASIDLFREFGAAGGRRIVCAGSCAEYEGGLDEPCTEDVTPTKPATLYGACKHALHTVLEAYARLENLSAAWARIFFLYGPHEHPSRLVSSVICSILRNEPALCSHGQQVRDFLYVGDVADAFAALLESDARGAVNIGSGQPVRLMEVIKEIGDQMDGRDLIRLNAVTASPDEPRLLVAKVDRLNREVGWQPKYDLREGLEKSIAWWRSNQVHSSSLLGPRTSSSAVFGGDFDKPKA